MPHIMLGRISRAARLKISEHPRFEGNRVITWL